MKVQLYVTCLVDQCWPEVGLASASLLEHLGCELVVDDRDTCCGQPFCNSGYPAKALPLAKAVIESFERSGAEAWVAPSGSCTGQIHHYPGLFEDDESWRRRAEHLAAHSFELSDFLTRQGLEKAPGTFAGRVAWHDSCHALRGLGVAEQPRALLRTVPGLELVEFEAGSVCCGFGGTFSVKLPDLSVAIADHKLDHLEAAGVDVLSGVDASCLIHLRGRLERRGSAVRSMHFAELLTAGTH